MAPESLVEGCGTIAGGRVWATELADVRSAPDHLTRAAAGALGWAGVVLPPMVLLGRRVVVVARLLDDVHERRVRTGWAPVTDRVSVATWSWPEMQHLVPSAAVTLSGVIAPARHWRTGLTSAAPFAALCPTALLLPAPIARAVECLNHAQHYGPAVLAAAAPGDPDPAAVDVVRPGRPRPRLASFPTPTSRWVHEMVYAQLLAVR